MKPPLQKALVGAFFLIALGIAGYYWFNYKPPRSTSEQINPNQWRVKLSPVDGYFDTGIPLNDSTNEIKITGKENDKWIIKLEDKPYSATGEQKFWMCVSEYGEIAQGCMFVSPGWSDNLLIKNDGSSSITLIVEVTQGTRVGRKK